jgi:hypothetical protein
MGRVRLRPARTGVLRLALPSEVTPTVRREHRLEAYATLAFRTVE